MILPSFFPQLFISLHYFPFMSSTLNHFWVKGQEGLTMAVMWQQNHLSMFEGIFVSLWMIVKIYRQQTNGKIYKNNRLFSIIISKNWEREREREDDKWMTIWRAKWNNELQKDEYFIAWKDSQPVLLEIRQKVLFIIIREPDLTLSHFGLTFQACPLSPLSSAAPLSYSSFNPSSLPYHFCNCFFQIYANEHELLKSK